MLFQNNGATAKVRVPEGNGYKWVTMHTEDIKDLPQNVGLAQGFTVVEAEEKQVTKGSIGKVVVETKQFEEELTKIKGLGKKTAKDLVKVYPTKAALKKAIQSGEDIPVRDDVESKLKKKFK